jgi:hypothetical protein
METDATSRWSSSDIVSLAAFLALVILTPVGWAVQRYWGPKGTVFANILSHELLKRINLFQDQVQRAARRLGKLERSYRKAKNVIGSRVQGRFLTAVRIQGVCVPYRAMLCRVLVDRASRQRLVMYRDGVVEMLLLEWLHGSLAARAVMEQWLDREQSVQG